MVSMNPAERHLQPVPDRVHGPGPVTDLAAAQAMARAEVTRARAALPVVDPLVFDCHLGEVARKLDPTTEADPVAVLASLVCAAGVHLGQGPHVRAGDDAHPLLVWPLLIGRTGGGRKGASWGTAKRLLSVAVPEFVSTNVRSGLTSGEGLAALFAAEDACYQCGKDTSKIPVGAYIPGDFCSEQCEAAFKVDSAMRAQTGDTTAPRRGKAGQLPPGDRRLVVFEPEWAAVMARMKREGNSLSATLRAAWEGGDLSTLNVTARIAPESHIGILAHITPQEFQAKLSTSDLAGGTYNRFLPLAVARSKFLPVGGGASPDLLKDLGAELAARLDRAGRLAELRLTPAGAELWCRLYVEFSTDPDQTGPVEQFLSRSAPNCLRIAAIHAALDHGHPRIAPEHLEPAAALVRFSRATAQAVLSRSDTDARLVAWLAEAGPDGRTRTEITRDFFRGNTSRDGISPAAVLDRLVAAGLVTVEKRARAGGGRAAEVFIAVPTNLTK